MGSVERFEIKDVKGNNIPVEFRTLKEQGQRAKSSDVQKGTGGQDLFIRVANTQEKNGANEVYVPGIQVPPGIKRPGSKGY